MCPCSELPVARAQGSRSPKRSCWRSPALPGARRARQEQGGEPICKIPSSTANTRPAFICHLQIYPKVFQELSPLCLFASTSSRDIVPRFVFTVTPFCFRWRITQSRAFPCCMGPGLCLTSFAPPWRESVSSDEPFLVQCHHFFPGFSWRK